MIDGDNVKEITQVINGKNVTFNEYSTALTHSAFIGDIDTCKWLIEHGTDVNVKDVNNVTLLKYAEETDGLERIAKFLKSRGAC